MGASSMQVRQNMNQEMAVKQRPEQGNATPPMMAGGPQAAAPAGENGGAASVQGMQTNMQALPSNCSQVSITNPDELHQRAQATSGVI